MVNTKKAFTLVELIVIITTIAALFTTAFIAFQSDNTGVNVDDKSPYSYDIDSSWDNSYKRMQMATYYDENSWELVVSNYSIDNDM